MKVLVVSADRTGPTGRAVNLGDAFLTDALADGIRERGHQVSVLELGDAVRRPPRRADWPISRRGLCGMASAVHRADLVIVGGGTLLQDDAKSSIGGLPRLVFVVSALGWLMHTPVSFFAVGCDPIARRTPRLLITAALFHRTVFLRDCASVRRCRKQFRRQGGLAADAALLYRVASKAPDQPQVVASGTAVALNAEDCGAVAEGDVAALAASGRTPVFINMVQRGDGSDSARLPAAVRGEFGTITDDLDWRSALLEYAGVTKVVASRMHGLYMAAQIGVSCVAVGNSPKIAAFCEEFEIPRARDFRSAIAVEARPANVARLRAARERVVRALDDVLNLQAPQQS